MIYLDNINHGNMTITISNRAFSPCSNFPAKERICDHLAYSISRLIIPMGWFTDFQLVAILRTGTGTYVVLLDRMDSSMPKVQDGAHNWLAKLVYNYNNNSAVYDTYNL